MLHAWWRNELLSSVKRDRPEDDVSPPAVPEDAVLYVPDGAVGDGSRDDEAVLEGTHFTATPFGDARDVIARLTARYGKLFELALDTPMQNTTVGASRYVVKRSPIAAGEFPAEARALIRLLAPTSTHVNRLHALVYTPRHMFIVTPNVFGRDLNSLDDEHFRATPGATDTFLAHMRDAVASLWRVRLFHTDITANNILVADLGNGDRHYTLIDYDEIVILDAYADDEPIDDVPLTEHFPPLTRRSHWRLAYALSMALFTLMPALRRDRPTLQAAVRKDVLLAHAQAFPGTESPTW